MNNTKTINWEKMLKISCLIFLVAAAWFYASNAHAEITDIEGLHTQITSQFSAIIKLMFAVAYVAGFGFVAAAIFKFKQHKDNPTQIPMGTPIAMLLIGIALIFLPNIIKPAGTSLFGEGAVHSGVTGEGATGLIED